MKKIGLYFIISLFSYMTYGQKPDSARQFKAYWQQGFHVQSENGHYDLKFGGRLMNDWAFYNQEKAVREKVGAAYAGTEFRRARLFSSGHFYNSLNYKLQFDFAGGDVAFKDAYLEFTQLPGVGNLKIGHYFEPFGMEQNTSSKYITFMARGLNDAFTPGRNVGMMLHNDVLNKRMTWAGGVFRQTDGAGMATNMVDYYNITGRVTGTPIYNDTAHQIIHLGLAYSFRRPNNQSYTVSTRPETHMSPYYLNTGVIPHTQNVNQMGYEAALFWGSFSLQGEFNTVSVEQHTDSSTNTYLFNGYYAMASYFITGEYRSYNRGNGTIGRTHPKNNFMNGDGGMGALELTLRYSGLNLNDQPIEAGQLNNITAGLNWYPNPSTKIMFNYQYAQLQEVGLTHIYQMRFQVDF